MFPPAGFWTLRLAGIQAPAYQSLFLDPRPFPRRLVWPAQFVRSPALLGLFGLSFRTPLALAITETCHRCPLWFSLRENAV